jgi:hypothetical protein
MSSTLSAERKTEEDFVRIVKLLHEAELERANTDREIKGTYPSRGCTWFQTRRA